MNEPNFFIVGAPKCGTTALNDYLARHPEVFMAEKEMHHFGRDLKMKDRISLPDYLAHFREAANRKIRGEASVWYLFSETAAAEIQQFAPDAKIVIMLRNPVQVIHSLHSQHLYDGNEDVFDFETAVSLDEARKRGERLPDSVDYFELPPYRDSVLFYRQVKRYLDVFPPDQVKVVLYDDFRSHTPETVAEVFRFLGLEPIDISYKVINANKQVRRPWLHRLLKRPPGRLQQLVRLLLPFRPLRHWIMSQLFQQNISIQKRGEMPPALKRQLQQYLAADITALSQLIRRDLSAWL
ncbi:sulfotransferase [Paraflavisolibacter sp. H34]|uniref:sulfotransferase family protein n=1 Tax=Huijunlia imazamoxiresistens TaxID=3127457 RepID=UPI00301ADD54